MLTSLSNLKKSLKTLNLSRHGSEIWQALKKSVLKFAALKTRKKLRAQWRWLRPVKCEKRKNACNNRDLMRRKYESLLNIYNNVIRNIVTLIYNPAKFVVSE